LIESGRLELTTTARSVLGGTLPLINEEVTVEQLLAHRSGIGDHYDEEAGVPEYLPLGVHELDNAEAYLPLLKDLPPKFEPGARFSYCNAGYVVLALI